MLRAMRVSVQPFLMLSVLPGAVALMLFGCAYGAVRQVLRAQFASELHCGEVQIHHRDAWYAYDGPDQYKVSGCGVVRTYTCPDTKGLVSYDKPACSFVDGDADAPVMAKPEPSEDEPPLDNEPSSATPEPVQAQEPAKPAEPAKAASPASKAHAGQK
jgi:hypothetical protein